MENINIFEIMKITKDMEIKEYIESGILELYVFGKLDETESKEVTKIAGKHPEIQVEIESIEKAAKDMASGVAPHLSAKNYEKIKKQIIGKKNPIIHLNSKNKNNWSQYIGWVASVLLLLGIGYQYSTIRTARTQITTGEIEKNQLQENLRKLELKNQQNESVLAIIRDDKNSVIKLEGQQISPEASAKVYWNKEKQTVYIDAAGLPEPPEGKVYQVWVLKLNPMTPKSIGLLNDFTINSQHMFSVDSIKHAEAFGITLESAGGNTYPTLDQLYTLGKV